MISLQKVLYMEITNDKYELPLAVADSAEELARMRKVKPNSIYNLIWSAAKRKGKSRYIKVVIED